MRFRRRCGARRGFVLRRTTGLLENQRRRRFVKPAAPAKARNASVVGSGTPAPVTSVYAWAAFPPPSLKRATLSTSPPPAVPPSARAATAPIVLMELSQSTELFV